MKLTSIITVTGILISGTCFSQLQTTIAALRTLSLPSITQTYIITDQGREGIFFYDPRDLNSLDNGGTVILNGTKRYKRLYSGPLDVRWFGMKGDYNGTTGTDNTALMNSVFTAAVKGQTILIPDGQYYFKSSIALPLTTVKKIKMEITGNIFFAKGAGFIIEGADQDFRSTGLICGLNTGATTEAAFAAYSGEGIYLKNAMNCYVEVNEIKDFKYGIHQSGDRSGGTAVGSQFNRVYFNSIHHCHTQIRMSIKGTTTSSGNWNNESFFYGGQLGRGTPGVTYGAGGWYGIVFERESSSNAKYPMDGHMFHDIGFEGLEVAIVMKNAERNTFFGGGIEPDGTRRGIEMDPLTCSANKFIGLTHLEEHQIPVDKLGTNTIFASTPIWTGTTNKGEAGQDATTSVTPNKLLITTNKYNYTNFVTNTTHDLISQTGQFPTLQAMMYRINGVTRSVPYKKTFFHVKTSTAGSPLALPSNVGLVRVEANQAKVFRIDVGDLAIYGEEFLVEYFTPAYPISFVRSDNAAVLIAATQFTSYGTYRCLWTDGQYKVSKIGGEYKTITQDGPSWAIAEGTETHYVNYQWGTATATLPAAATWPGRVITIKNLQAAKTVQVTGVSTADENILQGRGSLTVKSDGVTWNVIGSYKRGITY